MTAEIIWDFTAIRHAQIEAEKNERAAEMLAFCLEGAPQAYMFDAYGSKPINVENFPGLLNEGTVLILPPDCEPA